MEHLSRTYPLDEPISPSSLLPPHLHHPHLVELQQIPVNWDIIDYCIEYIVAFLLPFRPDVPRHRLKTSFFAHVACNVVSRSETEIGTLLVALSFINRAGDAFAKNRHLDLGKPWDAEDLFIAALMLANKAVDDSPYPLSYWEAWTTVMNKKTLCTLERHFLMLIDYDIKVKEEELLRHYDGVMQYCIRERGGWHRLMDLLRSDAVERDDQPPPRQHPAPIGTGRPRGDAPQQPRAGPPSERRPEASSSARPYPEYRQAERPPSQYSRAQHPAAPPPSARHPPPEARAYEPPALPHERDDASAPRRPAPPAPWQAEARPPLPSYDHRVRRRSRSPTPRRPHLPAARSPYREAERYGRWDPYPRSDRRVRTSREHILDHDDDPRPRRSYGQPSRMPYDGDRYHRSRGHFEPAAACLPPLRELWRLQDDAPDYPNRYRMPSPVSCRRYDDPRWIREPSLPRFDDRHARYQR